MPQRQFLDLSLRHVTLADAELLRRISDTEIDAPMIVERTGQESVEIMPNPEHIPSRAVIDELSRLGFSAAFQDIMKLAIIENVFDLQFTPGGPENLALPLFDLDAERSHGEPVVARPADDVEEISIYETWIPTNKSPLDPLDMTDEDRLEVKLSRGKDMSLIVDANSPAGPVRSRLSAKNGEVRMASDHPDLSALTDIDLLRELHARGLAAVIVRPGDVVSAVEEHEGVEISEDVAADWLIEHGREIEEATQPAVNTMIQVLRYNDRAPEEGMSPAP